jgi:hypothetical protein
VSETSTLLVGKSQSDSFSISEQISKAFSTSLSDAFTIDDLFDSELTQLLDKANVFGVSDVLAFSHAKPLSDSASIAESIAISAARSVADTLAMQEALTAQFTKSLSDSASVSESISVTLISAGSSSVFNQGAFNAFAFNE